MLVSPAERVFLKEGVEQNVRLDGRARMDYRYFNISTGVIAHANGSARLKLDSTEVLVVANLEIGQPDIDTPDLGKLVCSVECKTSASADFEGRGAENINVQLTRDLERVVIDSKSIDLRSLCIAPGKQCWVLYIDALVLDSAGSLIDAISLATKAALQTTSVPKVTVVRSEDNPDEEPEIEVSDDPYEAKPLPAEDVPLAVTLTKIGSSFVVDATLEEELCASARVTVCVNRRGQICGTHKSGPGGIAPSALLEMIRCARKIGVDLIGKVGASKQKSGSGAGSGSAGAAGGFKGLS